jgi:hypothetical protein
LRLITENSLLSVLLAKSNDRKKKLAESPG